MSARNLGTKHYSVPDADRKSPRKSICLPREMWERVDARAAALGLDRSAFVRLAVEKLLVEPHGKLS